MNIIPKDPFILVDGCSFLFRAYYALPPLITSKGMPTGAIFGVISMIRRLLVDYDPTNIAIVFDSPEKTFRHEQFPEYKANRDRAGDDLVVQIPVLLEVIQAMGLPIIKIPGIEADDIIGTLAITAQKAHLFTLIVTQDKDLAQLVTDDIILANTMNNTILDRAGVIEKFAVGPELIIDLLSLIGDTADNIPGIPMVGPKTAIKWLHTYGNLTEIIKHNTQITGKVGENLQNNLDKLALYKDLVTIRTNLYLPCTLADCKKQPADLDKLRTLFQELEFKKWFIELAAHNSTQQNTTKVIVTQQELGAAINTLQAAKIVGIHVFGDHDNVWQANLISIILTDGSNSFYIPCQQIELAPKPLVITIILKFLAELFTSDVTKVMHNCKYSLELLAKNSILIQPRNVFDLMLASYVLSSSRKHDLEALVLQYLNRQLLFTKKSKGSVLQLDISKALEYANDLALALLTIYNTLEQELNSGSPLYNLLHNIELPLIYVLQTMETRGILVDSTILNVLSEHLGSRINALEKEIFILSGEEFNINSPKQLQVILYDKLKLPVLGKTKTGQNTTSEDALQELAEQHRLPAVILEYRSLSKLKSTYADGLLKQIADDHRLHTTYQQAITSTGRLSSIEPNLQNIPVRTEEGNQIRRAFIAPQQYLLLCADYSQIELRLLAHLSQDPTLLAAFKAQQDIHTITAAEVFKVAPNKVTAEERHKAKAINFGLMYGMSDFGLSKQLGITKDEAAIFIKDYFARFPKILTFIEAIKEFATTHGYVETLFGRRIYLPDLKAKHYLLRKAAERAAINAPMQGAQADLIKMAMLKIHDFLRSNHPDTHMLLQVHDELIFEVPESKINTIAIQITQIMSTITTLSTSLDVHTKIGKNWGEVIRN